MSDKQIRVRQENLDDQPTGQPAVDETAAASNNQSSPKTVKMKALDLEEQQPKKQARPKGTPMTQAQKKRFMTLGAVAIIAGVATGFGAFKLRAGAGGDGSVSPTATQQVAGENVQVGDVFGVKDDQTFKDSAEGYLEAGGINGEGSHSLLREGGESQTVYLTSSITDLDKLVGMRVKVWGETFKGQKAGWLMDIGRVQVLELDAEPPVTE